MEIKNILGKITIRNLFVKLQEMLGKNVSVDNNRMQWLCKVLVTYIKFPFSGIYQLLGPDINLHIRPSVF